MLSKERKQAMIASLKRDYVVLTDIVIEVVADTEADMFMLEREHGMTAEMAQDKQHLAAMKSAYSALYRDDPTQAVEMIEQIYELSDKYDKLRIGR